MQMVIDIPENIFKKLKHQQYYDVDVICKSILSGTPLPKNHGRLIDADELKTMSYEVFLDTDNPNRADGLSACNGLVEDDIDLAPTIIEGSDSE